MIRNFLVRYYTPEGYSLIRNIRGEGVQRVREGLMQDGYMPLFIIPNIFLDIFRPLQNAGMRDKELSVFFIELYQLTQSAGSVGKAFNYMNKEAKKPAYDGKRRLTYGFKRLYYNHRQSKLKNKKKLVKDFIFSLDKGQSVREVFALNHFEEIVLSLVDLAASTGDYPQIFLKISGFFETKDTYKKSVIGAIAYPAFLFFLLFVAFAVFLYYIIPTFASFFGQFPHVPLSTKETLNLFIYVKSIFMYIALFLGITIFLFLSNLFEAKTKLMSFIMGIPRIRNIFNYNYLSWFFYQFSIMISSGLTVTAILNYFRENTNDHYFKHKFDIAYADLMDGFALYESLNNADFLNEDVIESIEYAEIGGFLPDTIMRLSKEFKEKSNFSMKLFTKGLFFSAMVSVVALLLLMFFVLFLPLIQGMVSLPGNY